MDKHIIINVGRQLGSGGRVIAARIAKDFGIRFFDKELLDLAAEESGLNKRFFEHSDERKGLRKFVYSSFAPLLGNSQPYENGLSSESLFKFQSDAIRRAAERGSCVFVGRCADYVLRDMSCIVNIFITADMDDRVERLSSLAGISLKEAEQLCVDGDARRAKYYNYYSSKTWGSASSYDFCINSSRLGIDGTVVLIEDFIRKRFDL